MLKRAFGADLWWVEVAGVEDARVGDKGARALAVGGGGGEGGGVGLQVAGGVDVVGGLLLQVLWCGNLQPLERWQPH
jgi:hypothetical protein